MRKRILYFAGVSDDPTIGSYVREDFLNLKNIYERQEEKGEIIFRTDENFTTTTFSKRFFPPAKVPWLFYFSGHSTKDKIQLTDKDVKKNHLIKALCTPRITKELELVYLSSCDSSTLGRALTRKGINVVIASVRDVIASIANVVSSNFFGLLAHSDNIQEAYDQTEAFFKLQRDAFAFDHSDTETLFPFRIISENETATTKSIIKNKFDFELEHLASVGSVQTQIDLTKYFYNYAIKHKKSFDKALVKERLKSTKTNLEKSLSKITDKHKSSDVIEVWNSSHSESLKPWLGQLMHNDETISNIPDSEHFKVNVKNAVGQAISTSDNLLKFLD